MHEYTLNCKWFPGMFLLFYSLAYLIWCSFSPASSLSYPNLPTASFYLYSFRRYCEIGENPQEVMTLGVIYWN